MGPSLIPICRIGVICGRAFGGMLIRYIKKCAIVLIENGKAAANVQDLDCKSLRDIAAHTNVFEAIRQGLDDAKRGRTLPARRVFAELRRKHRISR